MSIWDTLDKVKDRAIDKSLSARERAERRYQSENPYMTNEQRERYNEFRERTQEYKDRYGERDSFYFEDSLELDNSCQRQTSIVNKDGSVTFNVFGRKLNYAPEEDNYLRFYGCWNRERMKLLISFFKDYKECEDFIQKVNSYQDDIKKRITEKIITILEELNISEAFGISLAEYVNECPDWNNIDEAYSNSLEYLKEYQRICGVQILETEKKTKLSEIQGKILDCLIIGLDECYNSFLKNYIARIYARGYKSIYKVKKNSFNESKFASACAKHDIPTLAKCVADDILCEKALYYIYNNFKKQRTNIMAICERYYIDFELWNEYNMYLKSFGRK